MALADGAMGTMLQSLGLGPGEAPEVWNRDHHEKVQSVHRGYVEAGSQIILTNSFGGSRYRLGMHGLEGEVRQLNRLAAELAREVAGDEIVVGGSMGPTGELLTPLGTATFEDLKEAFAEQAAALVEGGVDYLHIETMSALEEVHAAIEGVRSVTDKPITATMTFDTHYHTMMGVSPKQAAETIGQWGVVAFGANCGNGPEEIIRVIGEMKEVAPDAWLIAKANAGLPRLVHGETIYDATPEDMANYARTVMGIGVKVVGACCGSTPAHVKAMRKAVDEFIARAGVR